METENNDTMNDQMRQEWSRHYDTLQWGVIAIFTAVIAALVGASFDSNNKESTWPEIAGYVLIIISIFFVASFRSFRSQLHSGIKNEELQKFLISHGERRWWPHQ